MTIQEAIDELKLIVKAHGPDVLVVGSQDEEGNGFHQTFSIEYGKYDKTDREFFEDSILGNEDYFQPNESHDIVKAVCIW